MKAAVQASYNDVMNEITRLKDSLEDLERARTWTVARMTELTTRRDKLMSVINDL